MSLINCPKCGKKVSSEANKCPGCGYRIKTRYNDLSWRDLLSIFGVLLLVRFMLYGIF